MPARPLLPSLGALLLVLLALKLGLLFQLQSDLAQTHLRIRHAGPTAFDHASWLLCLGLSTGVLALLTRRAREWSRWEIVWLNVGLLVTGCAFVFFTRHQGPWNYLHPVLSGTLPVRSIWDYLALDLFFAPPYLALYLLAYGLAFWWLWSAGRIWLSFAVMAGLGGLYGVLNLWVLAELGAQLVVVNAVGLLSWLGWRVSRGPLPMALQGLPLALLAPGWAFFSLHSPEVARPNSAFVGLVILALGLHAVAVWVGRRGGSHRDLSHFLPFFFLAFLLLGNRYTPLADNFNQLFVCGLTVGRYAVEELLLALMLYGVATGVAQRQPRLGRVIFDLGALTLVAGAVADDYLLRRMGMRLDWNALVVADDWVYLWRTIRPFVGWVALALTVGGLGYRLLAGALARLGQRWGTWPAPATAVHLALPTVLGLVALAIPGTVKPDKAHHAPLVNLVATSPRGRGLSTPRLASAEFERLGAELRLLTPPPKIPAASVAADARLNLFLIVLESSHNRYLSLFGAEEETQPLLARYRERMELFPDFYANFPNSFHARFAILTGLMPPKEYVSYLHPRIAAPTLFEILHPHGYTTALYDSCARDYVRWNDFIGHRQLDVFHDARTMPGREAFPTVSWGVLETATMRAIQRQFAEYARIGRRFCLAYMPVAPHMPFDSPAREFERFDNGAPLVDGNYTGRYKNQLLYMDWVVASLIETLEQLALLDHTLVVITSDHGEMVGEEKGLVGHGWRLHPQLCNVPLILLDPRVPGGRTNYTRGSQIDLLPTILDRLQIPPPPGALFQGVSLFSDAARADRPIWLNSYQHRARIAGDRFVLEERQAGQRAADARLRSFVIQHEGIRTVFRETEEEHGDLTRCLDQYERFQKSLIVHYEHYQQLHAGPARSGGVLGLIR